MAEPRKITAGLSYSWDKSLTDYPATAWTLAYSIVNNAEQYDVTASADGDGYDVAITKAATAVYEPGAYRLIGYVDDGTDRKQVYIGDLIVEPDFTNVSDRRSYAEKTLEAIEALIANAASKDQESVTVDGQTLVRRKPVDLIMLRDRFKREVAAEKRAADMAAGIGGTGRVQLRFK